MKIPILLYHSISTQAAPSYRPWALPPEEFEAHVAYLLDHGYTPMTVSSLVQIIKSDKKNFPKLPVVITFDDGLADFLSGAMPILKNYQVPATLYVTTGYVGGTSSWLASDGEGERPMLTWKEIAESLDGVEIGSHSHSHHQMDIIPLSEARDEIFKSKNILDERLPLPVHSFAFPHGYHTKKLVEFVEESGFTSSCIVGHAMATDTDNVFALPRIIISNSVTTDILARYLQGVGLRNAHGAWRNLLRRGWRTFRRYKKWRGYA